MLFDFFFCCCCCFSHTDLATGITVPEYTSNQHTVAFTQVVLQIRERSDHCQKRQASYPTPMPSRLIVLQSLFLWSTMHEKNTHLLHRKKHWGTCLRHFLLPGWMPYNCAQRTWPQKTTTLFSKRELINWSERTVCLLYPAQENI